MAAQEYTTQTLYLELYGQALSGFSAAVAAATKTAAQAASLSGDMATAAMDYLKSKDIITQTIVTTGSSGAGSNPLPTSETLKPPTTIKNPDGSEF